MTGPVSGGYGTPVDDAEAGGAFSVALERAGDAAVRVVPEPAQGRDASWDLAAVRGIVAMVLYALHQRERVPVEAVSWSSAAWCLRDDAAVVELVESVLPHLRTAVGGAQPDGADPVARTWWWLNRTWRPPGGVPLELMGRPRPGEPVDAGEVLAAARAQEPWDGMVRGIARDLPDPAVEICAGWARIAASGMLLAEHGGLEPHTRVQITAGPLDGQYGYVDGPVWAVDEQEGRVLTPPAAYAVDLDDAPPGDAPSTVDAGQLSASADGLAWPRRRAGSARDRPAWTDETPEHRTVATEVDALLRRAANPQDVPEPMLAAMRAASRITVLVNHRGATPRPNRWSWTVFNHAYDEDSGADGEPLMVAEVWFTRHAADPNPLVHLAPGISDLRALIESRTGQRSD